MLFRLMIEMLMAKQELRGPLHAGLNRGKARNALTRAAFFYQRGKIRNRSFEPGYRSRIG
ncbi:MAG: Tn3 family transposase [Nitrosospira sp.]